MPRQLFSDPHIDEPRLPLSVEELIDLLKKIYPEPTPNPAMTHDQIMYAAGQRSVVLYLLGLEARAHV